MLFPTQSARPVINTFIAAMMVALINSEGSAAEIVPGELIQVSGRSIFGVEMSVIEYFAPIAPADGARNVGDTERARFELDFTGSVDDRRDPEPFVIAGYHFSNGWAAFTDIPSGSAQSNCGLVIDYCVGELAGPAYRLVDSSYEYFPSLVVEGADPLNGDPVNWSFFETVIFENINNPEDFHYFTAGGRSIPASLVPLPSALSLMFGVVACLAGIHIRRRRHLAQRPLH
jgi:hypothetical protein